MSEPTKFSLKKIDCLLGMAELAPESVDIVVTSPPYNLGIKYSTYEDSRSNEDYLAWSCQWISGVKRILKDQGSLFLNVGSAPSNPLMPHEVLVALKNARVGFHLQNTFHWIKSISVETRAGEQFSVGHFKPINSPRYVNDCHEYVFHLTKHGNNPVDRLAVGVPYSDKSNIARWSHTKGSDKRCRGNNWFIPYETICQTKDRPHPATFPVDLAVNCIKLHGQEKCGVMLDPFVGIGHSALAAKVCGIPQFIGFDIDADYLEVAEETIRFGLAKPASSRRKRESEPVEELLL